MRERLIQLLQEAEGQAAYYDGDDAYGVSADYLLDNGVIVPPVRVGQIVWAAYYSIGKFQVDPFRITALHISQNKRGIWTRKYTAHMFDGGKTVDVPLYFSFEEIGKNVHLTKKAAEATLKARENK